MSVRVADRNLSKMEYIHNAQIILNLTTERINKYVSKISNDARYKHFVKSSQYSIWNSPIYHAQMLYQYTQMANKTRDTNKRLEYLNNASQNLELLETSLETFYKRFKAVINDKFIMLITEKIDYEKKLLKGCYNYSRNVSC